MILTGEVSLNNTTIGEIMRTLSNFKLSSGICSAVAVAAALAYPTCAIAAEPQTTEPQVAEIGSSSGDIVVTARRKEESILKTPISIKALTADEIAAKNITTIQDIGQATPGLNIQQTATQGARADRSFTSIQLRGFVPTTSASQTTSIFIDGAPISVATGLQSLTNPERVEVIKGPQSALFGRQTFAGAINVVTKAPSDHLTGSVALSGGTRANYDVSAEISAPIVEDVLSFRASVRGFGKHGSYHNAIGPDVTLGDQSTLTGSLAIEFKPTSRLTIKALGLASELKDGAPAQILISARPVVNSAGQTLVADQSNCFITGVSGRPQPFICGQAPAPSSVAPSANFATTSTIAAFLARTTGRVLTPEQGVKGFGLVNHFRHYHVNADWEMGDSGVTLSSLTAFNREQKSELADVDNYYSNSVNVGLPTAAQPEGYYDFPILIEGNSRDFSQELRGSFEDGGPLHASAGGSYLFQRNQSDFGSPILSLSFSGAAQSRTYGIFGSVGYDFSEKFTLSADARYQIDKIYAFAGQGGINNTPAAIAAGAPRVAEGALIVSQVYKNFLPRVIGQFNIDQSNMFFASYSKGVNPGQFNTTFITSPEPQVRAFAQSSGFSVVVNPEKITNYEIGAKGRLFDMLRYDTAVYLAMWTDQIQSQSVILVANGSGPAPAGTNIQAVAATNSGKTKVWGVEASVGIDLAPGLTLDLAGAYTKTSIISATNVSVTNFYGIRDFKGKENPFVSKWTGNASLAYTTALSDSVDVFGRTDFNYKSGAFTDISNLSWGPDQTQVNVRAGVRNATLSIEGYVTNLFNNRGYYNVGTSGLNAFGVATNGAQFSSLVAAPRELRTIGVRGTFTF